MGTDDIMGIAVELFLEVDNGEGHAEKVDGIASPGQPARKARIEGRCRDLKPAWRAVSLPGEKETPLGQGETRQDVQQGSRSLYLLSLGQEVLDEVRRHSSEQDGTSSRERERKRAERERRGQRAEPRL